jgi:beta-lactamase regulating signal transducer with metallopeptidase domain
LNAATRHAALLVTLLVVAALPLLQWGITRRESSRPLAPQLLRIAQVEPEEPEATSIEDVRDEANPSGTDIAEAPSMVTAAPLTRWARVSEWLESRGSRSWITRWSLNLPGRWAVGGLALGLLVAAGLLLRLAHQYWLLRVLKRSSTPPDAATQDVFEQVRRDTQLDRPVRLVVHEDAPVPLALGFAAPAVVLPADLPETVPASELRQILRHELAHLARRDDWANLCQQTLRALLFFHPAVWMLSRRLTVEREIACDDQVIASASTPREYALLLCEFAGRQGGHPSVAASAAWSQPSQLKERIHMLLNPDRNASPRLARGRFALLAACSLGVALAGLRAAPRLSLTAPAVTPAADAAPSASASVSASESTRIETRSEVTADARPSVLVEATPSVSVRSGSTTFTATISSEDSAPLHKEPRHPDAPPAPDAPTLRMAPAPSLPPLPPPAPVEAVLVQTTEVEAPEPPEPPEPPEAPEPQRIKKRTKELPAPARDESLERRIRTLEKRVQELSAQNRDLSSANAKRVEKRIQLVEPRAEMELRGHDGPAQAGNRMPDGRPEDVFRDPKFAERMKHEMELAMQDQQQALKNAHQDILRAQKEAAESAARNADIAKQSFDLQRMRQELDLERAKLQAEHDALEKERRAMEQHVRNIERQMAKLERARSRNSETVPVPDSKPAPGPEESDGDPLVKPSVPAKR